MEFDQSPELRQRQNDVAVDVISDLWSWDFNEEYATSSVLGFPRQCMCILNFVTPYKS